MTSFVVFVERALRKIQVNYAKRQVGNKVYAGQQSFLPLKLNMAGVIPPIFASSIILFPATLAQWFGSSENTIWLRDVAATLAPGQPVHELLYAAAIIFFCFFYTALQYNPKETADNLKKSGAFIPGYRPGDQTAKYIEKITLRLTLLGSIYLVVVCFVPSDAMLGAALAAQPSLHERALAQRVVLVGPGSLMALLRTVAFTWQQDALSASARELLDLGRDLHRRLATLGAHTAKVGRSLQSSVEAYNAMVGALESRVMVTARRMHDLDLVGDEIPVLTPVETAPRPLTSQELIDAATAEDSRPDLLLDLGLPTPRRAHGIRDAG